MQERENISYAELSREDYIHVMQQGTILLRETLLELAKNRDFAMLGPAVIMRLRQQAITACRLLLQMEREGAIARRRMEECLEVMPASLKRFMQAYFGWGEIKGTEVQACQFLRETFLICAQQHQLKRYVKLVYHFPELIPETAELFMKHKHYVMALEMYEAVSDQQMTELARLQAMGRCAYYSGRFDQAKEYLQRSRELGDDSPEIPIFLQWIEESEAKHK